MRPGPIVVLGIRFECPAQVCLALPGRTVMSRASSAQSAESAWITPLSSAKRIFAERWKAMPDTIIARAPTCLWQRIHLSTGRFRTAAKSPRVDISVGSITNMCGWVKRKGQVKGPPEKIRANPPKFRQPCAARENRYTKKLRFTGLLRADLADWAQREKRLAVAAVYGPLFSAAFPV